MAQANPLFPVNCEFPVLEKDLKAEVTVIGAGIAGMSSAYHLANKGYDVIVLEEQQIGSGATSASSGILYYGSGTELTKAISLFGKEKARLLWEESRKTIESVVDLIQKNSIECHFRNPGAIIAAKNKEEQLFLEKELENLNGIGFEGKILPGSEIKNHFSKREFSSGLLQDAVVQIAPALFTAGLADASNLKVYSSSPLLSYTEADGFITVQTPKAKIKTEKILFATNRKPFFGLESYFFIENSVILASKKMSSEQIRKILPEHKILWTMEEKYDIIEGVA